MGQFGTDIGSCRSNNDKISGLSQRNVLYLVGEIPVKGIYHGSVTGELLKGERGDKLRGMFGHDDLHLCVEFDKSRAEAGCLIGSNTAGDTQQHSFSFQHGNSSRKH